MTLRTKQCWIVFSIKSMCSLDSYCTDTRPCQTFFVPSNRWRSLVSVFFRTIAKKWATDLHVIPRYLCCPDETNRTISNLRSINTVQLNPVVPERVTWLDWFRYSKKDEAWNYEFNKSEFCFQKRLGDLYLARYSNVLEDLFVRFMLSDFTEVCSDCVWLESGFKHPPTLKQTLWIYCVTIKESPFSHLNLQKGCSVTA